MMAARPWTHMASSDSSMGVDGEGEVARVAGVSRATFLSNRGATGCSMCGAGQGASG